MALSYELKDTPSSLTTADIAEFKQPTPFGSIPAGSSFILFVLSFALGRTEGGG
jgi:hypothetical protein